MEYSKLIKERFSVRKFSEKEIEEEKLNKIYEAGILAPTAKNNQPLKIYVLKSEEALKKVNEVSPCIYGAKTVFAVCFDKNEAWVNKYSNENSGIEDASIVCTHMMLEAWNEGIGSCWVNMYNPYEFSEKFELPENIVPVCLLPIGYISEEAVPSPFHSIYKNKEEIFVEL